MLMMTCSDEAQNFFSYKSDVLLRHTLVGEDLCTSLVFLFSQFSPIRIVLVQAYECYH